MDESQFQPKAQPARSAARYGPNNPQAPHPRAATLESGAHAGRGDHEHIWSGRAEPRYPTYPWQARE